MKWKNLVLLLLLFGLVGGCWIAHKEYSQRQPSYWTKANYNEQQCKKDIIDCGQVVSSTVPHSIVFQKAYGLDGREIFDSCMQEKGYRRRQTPAPKQMEPISVRQTKAQPTPPKGVDTIERPKTSTLVTPSSGTTNIVTVTWTSVNIRSGPGNNYSVVASVKQGDKLTVIRKSGEWFNVRLENGQQGWVANRVVK